MPICIRTLIVGLAVVFAEVPTNGDPPLGESQFPLLRQTFDSQGVIPSEQVSPLMQRKLEYANQILGGLAADRLGQTAENAKALKSLSLEAAWKVIQTETYAQHSRDFQNLCDLLEESADSADLSRATLAYVALTIRCVECHSYLRENKLTLTTLSFTGRKGTLFSEEMEK